MADPRSLDVIIPTYKNPYWFTRLLLSLQRVKFPEIDTIFVIDNGGDFDAEPYRADLPLEVIRPGRNMGWTKALNIGLAQSKAPFVMFLNDDTEFEPDSDRLAKLLSHFDDPKVGAVGPATGIAMGLQSTSGPDIEQVALLIGFCVVMRRKALDEIGGMDERFQTGGDDLDISIRLKDAGYKLLIDRRVFVYHHAFKTGQRLYGNSGVKGGWNSKEAALQHFSLVAQKHGQEKLREVITVPANRF